MIVIVKDKETADRMRSFGISYPIAIEVNPDYVEGCKDGLFVGTGDDSESVREAVRLENKIREALKAEKAFRDPNQHFLHWCRDAGDVVQYSQPPIEEVDGDMRTRACPEIEI